MSRLISDFYGAIECGHVTLLALLDLRMAFDTADFDTLSTSLNAPYSFAGQFLRCIDRVWSYGRCWNYEVSYE